MSSRRRDPARARERHLVLLALPAILVLGALFVWPVLRLLAMSVEDGSLAQFEKAVLDELYVMVMWESVRIAGIVTLICLVLAYPVAAWLAGAGRTGLVLGMFFLLLPFWTSALVRTYAWMVLLGNNGPLVWLVHAMGFEQTPQLLFTRFSSTLAIGMSG